MRQPHAVGPSSLKSNRKRYAVILLLALRVTLFGTVIEQSN